MEFRVRGTVEYEAQYLDANRARGLTVVDLSNGGEGFGFDASIKVMREGHDVIVQPTLKAGRWLGRADVTVVPEIAEPAEVVLLRGGGH